MVKVFTAQESVTIGGQHFKLLVAINVGNFDNRNVKRTTTQVINRDFAVALNGFVHTKSQSGSSRLIDDAFYFQTSDAACVFGGLALAVVKVSRNGNHRFSHRFTQMRFSRLFHFAQDFGRHLWWRQFIVLHFYPSIAIRCFYNFKWQFVDVFLHFGIFKTATNQAFYRINGVSRIGHGLAFGRRTHQDFAAINICHNRRRGACTFCIFDYFGLAIF